MTPAAVETLQWLRPALAGSGLILFMFLERAWPHAPRGEAAWRHYGRNLALATINVVAVGLVWRGLLLAAATWAEGAGVGLLPWLGRAAPEVELSRPGRIGITVLAFDALSYGMHVLYHRVPWLWRLHLVHHTDPDFDVTTASRFHAGEILLSTAVQTGAAVALGAPPEGVLGFQMLLLLQAQAQHSNLALGDGVDRVLRWGFVTPNMHRIHHSTVRAETDSNYATILSVWDRLGRTHRRRPQAGIVIGLAPYADRRELSLGRLLLLPFRAVR